MINNLTSTQSDRDINITCLVGELSDGAEFFRTTLADFMEANEDDEEVIEAAAAVRAGGHFSGGGGASPRWTVRPA